METWIIQADAERIPLADQSVDLVMGRAEWEREYYGDVLARIQEAQRQGVTHEPNR